MAAVTPRRAQSQENVWSSSSSGSRTPSCGEDDLPPAIPPRKNPPGSTLERRGPVTRRKVSAPVPSTPSPLSPVTPTISTTPTVTHEAGAPSLSSQGNHPAHHPNSSISPEHRMKFEYNLKKFILQSKDSEVSKEKRPVRPAVNHQHHHQAPVMMRSRQFSSHENLIGNGGGAEASGGRRPSTGNVASHVHRIQRQGSRDSLNSVSSGDHHHHHPGTSAHHALAPHPHHPGFGHHPHHHHHQQSRHNGNHLPFQRQTSHENLPYSSSSSSSLAVGRNNNNNGRNLHRPHSREVLRPVIHESPDDVGDGAALSSTPFSVSGGVSRGDHPLRRGRVYRSCDNIIQQNPPAANRECNGGGQRASDGAVAPHPFSPTKGNRPQVLYGIGEYKLSSGSVGNVGAAASASSPAAAGAMNFASPFARLAPSPSKEKPATPKRLPSSESLTGVGRLPASSHPQIAPPPPPIPPHGRTPPHEASSKMAGIPSRVLQPLTLEINPGALEIRPKYVKRFFFYCR